MTSRNKWVKGDHPIKEGTIVLLKEDNVPPNQWPLGRVIKIHPGSDGIVRTVTIKTSTNEFDRNVNKLVPLPNQSQDDKPQHPASKGDDTIPREQTTTKE
ncbi:hypothetical protein WH47_10767 [Habropoda laboriosa]|uniref:DUF5641 domain-containing protein n=2 Tax=Habropoda laboriosa TaxID=597456 RepID=A0A0L7QMK4_9HYME|nr:hypothetical protein WH47_10767 [Habropoda laboriosa]